MQRRCCVGAEVLRCRGGADEQVQAGAEVCW